MDSWIKSFLKGRGMAAILSFLIFGLKMAGYDTGEVDSSNLSDLVTMVAAGVSGILVLWSKIKDTKV